MLVCTADGGLHSSPEEPVTSTDLKVIKKKEKGRRKKYVWKHGSKSPALLLSMADYVYLLNPNYLWTRDPFYHTWVFGLLGIQTFFKEWVMSWTSSL